MGGGGSNWLYRRVLGALVSNASKADSLTHVNTHTKNCARGRAGVRWGKIDRRREREGRLTQSRQVLRVSFVACIISGLYPYITA